MNNHGIYIYGIINSGMNKFIANYSTEEEDKIYGLSYQDISAILDNSRIFDYSNLPKDILMRKLLKHQTIIEEIMNLGYTIIPMKLGTLVSDENEVRDILVKGFTLTKEIFKKIEDKIEIDVVANWSDFTSVVKEAGEEIEIKEFKERLLTETKGITVDDQIKIGSMLKKALNERRDKFAKEIQDNLKTFCVDFKTHELMDDNMVLNSAFLINKTKHKDFEIKVEELNVEFNEKLNFRCVGPLPPYSFYTLEIKKLKFENIDWARRKLGLLNDFITKDEIKKARHALAFSFHPDKNPDTPGIEKEFDEVTEAYKILWEYCQKDSCSFKEDEFERNAILVRLRG